ncbi:beta-1,3-glucanase family protein [Deinococcus hopiensis]|uniref:Peptidase inhibitor family I36 n=1 Tax=Deinococcus hopiensis KR-140 TaxID=695939 RepID=A0A1W1VHP1_9DEIO|nr:beta-1,3-glucanase family protein [Deinococcus hopiensis]SMB92848.1 Peptidase inhibitor family I36 [Deinococcus hopiensis KR-140]
MKMSWRFVVLSALSLSLAACGQGTPQVASAGLHAAATDYTNGVDVSGSTATIWFKSNVNTTWVDIHYTVNAGAQQNVRMTYNSATGRYEQKQTVGTGNVIKYSFTYNNGTAAYDSVAYSYTVGSSSGLACFYTDGNYTGTSFCASSDSGYVGADYNDKISSLKVQSGYQVVMYNDVNYGGTSKTFTGDVSFVGSDFNDIASSFRIVKTSSTGSIGSIAASSVPAPTGSGVMSLKVMNGTNGAYADSQIYWGVLGINPANGRWSYLDRAGNLQPVSTALNDATGHLTKNGVNYANIYNRISDAAWVSMPRITSGRMFLCVGTPCYIKTFDTGFAGPDVNNATDPNRDIYFDFVEFTVDATGYHGNTTRVDAFGFPVQHRLVNKAGNYDRTVGEPENETRAGIFSAFKVEVPTNFAHLATVQAPYRIVAPLFGEFRAGGPQGNYFDSYVNAVWTGATKPTTQNVLLCNGPLAETSGACAGLNRHVYQNTAAWNTPSQYYLAAPANYYAQFWHKHGIGGLAYGFAYDDYNQQASYLEVGDPKGLIVRVGW